MATGLESLYQELILDHSKAPRGYGRLNDAIESHQHNPLCGDDITLGVVLEIDGEHIQSVGWEGSGCSISQASASMLSELAPGLTPAAAMHLIAEFREVLRSRGTMELDLDTFGDAAALSGVGKYMARVKCAMLSWVALEDALLRSGHADAGAEPAAS